MRVKLCGLAAIAVLGPLTLGCGSVTPAMPNPITEPVVDHPGSSIVRYRDRVYGSTNISRFRHGLLLLKMSALAATKIRFH